MNKGLLAGILAIIVIAAGIGGYLVFQKPGIQPTQTTETPQPTPTPSPQPTFPSKIEKEIKITYPELASDYESNEFAADQKYKNQILIVVGKIWKIGKDPKEQKPYVLLGDERMSFMTKIRCFFSSEKEILELNSGEEVILRGQNLGKLDDEIILKDCSVVKEMDIDLQFELYPRGSDLAIHVKKFGYSLVFYLKKPGQSQERPIANMDYRDREATIPVDLRKEVQGGYENPVAGQYIILVKDKKGNILATKTFNFDGPVAKIEEVVSFGGGWYASPNELYSAGKPVVYYVKNVTLKVKNTGDLPLYLLSIDIFTNESTGHFAEVDINLKPGEERIITLRGEMIVKESAGDPNYELLARYGIHRDPPKPGDYPVILVTEWEKISAILKVPPYKVET